MPNLKSTKIPSKIPVSLLKRIFRAKDVVIEKVSSITKNT